MEDIFSFLTELANAPFRRLFTFRSLAILLAGSLSIGTYQLVVHSSENRVRLSDLIDFYGRDTITLYTGNSSGDYYAIGEALEASMKNLGIELINDESSGGGYQNAVKVWQKTNSFGFVQKQAFAQDDYTLNNIELITPLYTEHLHVLIDTTQIKVPNNTKEIVLGLNADTVLLKKILSNEINVGNFGTGSMWIGAHLIQLLQEQLPDSTHSKPIKTNHLKLTTIQDNIDAKKNAPPTLILMIAASNPRIVKLIRESNYRLVSLDPALVVALKDKYNLDIRPTSFKYPLIENSSSNTCKVLQEITTLGTYAYLVTGKNTSLPLMQSIISGLKAIKTTENIKSIDTQDTILLQKYSLLLRYYDSIRINMDSILNKLDSIKIRKLEHEIVMHTVFNSKDYVDFSEIFENKNKEFVQERNRTIFIFIISVLLSIIPFYIALIWIFSGFNYWKFLNEINKKVYPFAVPNNIIPGKRSDLNIKKYSLRDRSKLDEVVHHNKSGEGLMIPFFVHDQEDIINRILKGISTIYKIRAEAYGLLSSGGLTESHFNYLNERLENVLLSAKHNLFLRLKGLIAQQVTNENKEEQKWLKMEPKEKQKYIDDLYKADYLLKEEYEELSPENKKTKDGKNQESS